MGLNCVCMVLGLRAFAQEWPGLVCWSHPAAGRGGTCDTAPILPLEDGKSTEETKGEI
jgi:hypothetical protein